MLTTFTECWYKTDASMPRVDTGEYGFPKVYTAQIFPLVSNMNF